MPSFCQLSAPVDWIRASEMSSLSVLSVRRIPSTLVARADGVTQLGARPACQYSLCASSSPDIMLSALRSVSPLVVGAAALVAGALCVASAAAAARDDAFLILYRTAETQDVMENHNLALLCSVFNVGGGRFVRRFWAMDIAACRGGVWWRDPSPRAQKVRQPWTAALVLGPARMRF